MHPFALNLYLLQKLLKEAEMYVMLNPSYELMKDHDSMRMHNHWKSKVDEDCPSLPASSALMYAPHSQLLPLPFLAGIPVFLQSHLQALFNLSNVSP